MTKPELIERAKRQLNAGQPQPHMWPESEIDLAACVMQASGALGQRVMRDPSLRGLLQQEYSVTLDANGEGDLLAATGSVTTVAGEILLEGVHFGAVLDAEGQRLHPLVNYADFLRPQITVFGYYTIKDKATILTRARNTQVNTSFDVQSASGPLTVTASYTPASVDDFPEELADMLVQELCNQVTVKTKPANA